MKERIQCHEPKTRIEYVDVFRAIGIILMVMGHIGFGKEFNHYIHAFHMPMFFFVTGYFYKERQMSDLIASRLKTLILPYFVVGTFHIIVASIINGAVSVVQIRVFLFNNTTGDGVAISGALWFLTALFFSDVIYNLIKKISDNIVIVSGIVLAISISGMLLPIVLPFRLPWALDVAMVSVGLIHIGWLTKEKFTVLVKLPLGLSLLLFAVFSITSMLNSYVNMRHGTYGVLILFWVNSVGMTIALWNVSRYMNSILGKKYHLFNKWLVGIGKNSIMYLCFNQIVIKTVNGLIRLCFPLDSSRSIAFLAFQFLVLIITLILLLCLQLLISKSKVKCIFGR